MRNPVLTILFFVVLGLLLITVAGYGKAVAVVNQIEIVGGIIACGVFLLLISIVGNVVVIVGTYKLGFINLKIKPIRTCTPVFLFRIDGRDQASSSLSFLLHGHSFPHLFHPICHCLRLSRPLRRSKEENHFHGFVPGRDDLMTMRLFPTSWIVLLSWSP